MWVLEHFQEALRIAMRGTECVGHIAQAIQVQCARYPHPHQQRHHSGQPRALAKTV
ncbi:hypothetical protein D3C81_2297770 [compost metagenome]